MTHQDQEGNGHPAYQDYRKGKTGKRMGQWSRTNGLSPGDSLRCAKCEPGRKANCLGRSD